MKALSLHQPWASLIFGLWIPDLFGKARKKIETRHWPTRYRGQLAIHAAQTVDKDFCRSHEIDIEPLPRGAVIGVVTLLDCVPMTARWFRETPLLDADEWRWGNFDLGRYAWILRDPVLWTSPLKVRGRQGLFNVDVNV